MRKHGRAKRRFRRGIPRVLVTYGVVAVGAFVMVTVAKESSGFWKDFTRQAALASAMYSMPGQSLQILENRFSTEWYAEKESVSQEIKEPVSPKEEPSPSQEVPPQIGESTSNVIEPSEDAEPVSKPKPPPEEIPEEYQGDIIEENMSGHVGNITLSSSSGLIKNSTNISNEEVQELIESEDQVEISQTGPQVLIMHTHATESFEPYDSDIYDTRHTWRTTDNDENIVAVGEAVAKAIRAHGIEVLHDETQHDYPSYNGSYDRSAVTIQEYLDKYPTISVVLDVHRDAVQRDTTLVKPIAEINGKKAAQLMIIAGCDDGTMGMPNWRTNFRFAVGLQDEMESMYPGLTRPIFFCYRKYNQQMTTGSLLIEFGSHGNTLEEVLYTGQLAGDAIGNYLAQLKDGKK